MNKELSFAANDTQPRRGESCKHKRYSTQAARQTIAQPKVRLFLPPESAAMQLIPLASLLLLAVRHVTSQDCETLGSEIRVNKFLNVEHYGRQMDVRCGVQLTLNKCEGTCWSYESPSVIDPRGFRKKCNCCRERELVDRSVVLNQCYDAVSGLIVPGLHPVIVIKEPMNCECRECANFI